MARVTEVTQECLTSTIFVHFAGTEIAGRGYILSGHSTDVAREYYKLLEFTAEAPRSHNLADFVREQNSKLVRGCRDKHFGRVPERIKMQFLNGLRCRWKIFFSRSNHKPFQFGSVSCVDQILGCKVGCIGQPGGIRFTVRLLIFEFPSTFNPTGHSISHKVACLRCISPVGKKN